MDQFIGEFGDSLKCVILFSSIHQVMKAENLFKKKHLKVEIIPVPREISSDCGVAIELPLELKEGALDLLEENKISFLECYRISKREGFKKE